MFSALGRVCAVVLVSAAMVGLTAPVAGAVPVGAVAAEPVVLCMPGDVACDVDGDRIPDDVEEVVCGSVTCATGAEDRDSDGLGDWVEFQATGEVLGADPGDDADMDGIPDFAEQIVCGSRWCARGREDVDHDGVADWVEVVICGDATCADGTEDLDGDGVADATRLAACVVYGRGDGWAPTVWRQVFGGTAPGWLPRTGAGVAALLAAVVALVAAGVGAIMWSRRRGLVAAGHRDLGDLAALLDARDAK